MARARTKSTIGNFGGGVNRIAAGLVGKEDPRFSAIVFEVRTLGRYELMQPLARGGMAEVYLARRRVAGVEKRLVIKRLRRERIADPRFLDLFVREAQLSMSLVQQNIVPVFDFGRVGDDVFLAMEHIDGKDLGSTLARSRGAGMPAMVAAFVAAECCHALHHAHSGAAGQSVVHRDVTPRNVLLSWSGEVKLADFGIAAAMGAGDTSLVGTPGYMAPEQARGEALDARTDLYALGLVLWEMLTGEHVRSGGDAATLLELAKRNSLPALPAELPPALRALIERATATSPAQRLDSARQMADELDAFIIGERARHGGAAPAQQLAAYLATCWEGAREEVAEVSSGQDDRVVTFLEDGAAGVLGTGTMRSMAATGAAFEPSADGAPPAVDSEGHQGPEAGAEPARPVAAAPAPSRSRRAGWLLGALALVVVAVIGRGLVVGGAERPSPTAASAPAIALVVDAGASDARRVVVLPVAEAARDASPGVDASIDSAVDAAASLARDAGPPRHRPAERRARRDGGPELLDAGTAPAPALRAMTIGAKPWAHVTIDGKAERHETPVTVQLAIGPHRLRFENPELGVVREVSIEVAADGPSAYVLDLR